MIQDSCATYASQGRALHGQGSRFALPCLIAQARSNAVYPQPALHGWGFMDATGASPPAALPGSARILRGSRGRSSVGWSLPGERRVTRCPARAHSFVPLSMNSGTLSNCPHRRKEVYGATPVAPQQCGDLGEPAFRHRTEHCDQEPRGKKRRSPSAGCECSWLEGRKEVIRTTMGRSGGVSRHRS